MDSLTQADAAACRTTAQSFGIQVFDFLSFDHVHLPFNEGYLRILRAAYAEDHISFSAAKGHIERLAPRVADLANAAGVSRQHLTRVFREVIGVSPKRYCRLARFQAGLVHAGAGAGGKWAQVAADLGYADQSHMIAEFKELSGLTPEALATGEWFHPFILEAKSRRWSATSA